MQKQSKEEAIYRFWENRAKLGNIAGTNDYMLKGLEIDLLKKKISQKSSILDVGCGNGETLITLAQENNCTGVGIDFSEKMIEEAKKRAKKLKLEDSLLFLKKGIQEMSGWTYSPFDYVISERSLSNLTTRDEQHQAFIDIMNCLKPNGCYFMIENCITGFNQVNQLRKILNLEAMQAPWHNLFFEEGTIKSWENNKYILEETISFSSTYYFLSRVVYAKLVQDRKEELKYDSDINCLACKLPPIGDFGTTKFWKWRKKN